MTMPDGSDKTSTTDKTSRDLGARESKNTHGSQQTRYSSDLKSFKRTTSDGEPIRTILFGKDFQAKDCKEEIDTAILNLMNSGEQINNRRQSVNTFFQTINSALIGAYAWLLANNIIEPTHALQKSIEFFAIGIIGSWLCHLWRRILEQYLKISRSKIALIEELELEQKVRPFTSQYELCKGENYTGLNELESAVASLFQNVHIVLIVFSMLYFISALCLSSKSIL